MYPAGNKAHQIARTRGKGSEERERIMAMKKKILATVLTAAIALAMPLTAFAGTASSRHPSLSCTLVAECYTLNSSHRVSGASSGTARFYYTSAGMTLNTGPNWTNSTGGSWNATCSIASGNGYRATTTYSGYTVTATN